MIKASILFACVVALPAQGLYPDLLYYKFEEAGGAVTANHAVPGVGSPLATVSAQTLAPGTGQFGGGLVGAGGTGATDYVDSGWAANLPGDFTVSFWLDLTGVTTANPFMYVMGDYSANSFRIFTNGAAGTQGIILRQTGGLTDTIIPGGASPSAPTAVAWVYDSTVPEIRGYLNGVQVVNVAQPAFTVNGGGPFLVGAQYPGGASLVSGAVLDEFRLYGWALTSTEIAASWNQDLSGASNPFQLGVTSTPAGALVLDVQNVPTGTVEGWTFASGDTTLPVGAGAFFGLIPDTLALTIFLAYPFPTVGHPFHWLAGFPGVHPDVPFAFPDGTTSGLSGVSVDFLSIGLDGSYTVTGFTNTVRLSW